MQPGLTNGSTPNGSRSQGVGGAGPSASPSQQRITSRQPVPPSPSPVPGSTPVSPAAALMRQGSKRRNGAGTPTPGQGLAALPNGAQAPAGYATPNSAAAHIGVSVSNPSSSPTPGGRRSSQQLQHSYGTDYGAAGYSGQQASHSQLQQAQAQGQYGRSSPMVSSSVPPVVTSARAMGEQHQQAYAVDEPPAGRSSFWKILTCRCG